LSREELERVRGGGWDLALLRKQVDQLVLHFDAAGTSRACFKTLQDERDLSTHFLLDLDGTIYQTLDVKERAWHATTSNDRSVGVEIANVGAYPAGTRQTRSRAGIRPAPAGARSSRFPGGRAGGADGEFRGASGAARGGEGRSAGGGIASIRFHGGTIPGAGAADGGALHGAAGIRCDYPRDAAGKLAGRKLPDAQLKDYQGVLGHYHIQTNKVDPGPALQWDYVIGEARRLMKLPVLPLDAQGQPIELAAEVDSGQLAPTQAGSAGGAGWADVAVRSRACSKAR
jgi:N-acetylmuramoyl-L-alanine amidase